MTDTSCSNQRSPVISYYKLRRTIGILGILLPVLLVGGLWVHHFYAGYVNPIQDSISAYYHSIGRNIFVSIICAYAFFLFAYDGCSREDSIVANLAALFALGVVFFPMDYHNQLTMCCDVPHYVPWMERYCNTIHYTSAILFLTMLAYFSILIFTKTKELEQVCSLRFKKPKEKPSPEKKRRNMYHRVCGFTILVCIVLLVIYFLCFELPRKHSLVEPFHPIFVLECIALEAFGFSWLLKGIPSEKVDKVVARIRRVKKEPTHPTP